MRVKSEHREAKLSWGIFYPSQGKTWGNISLRGENTSHVTRLNEPWDSVYFIWIVPDATTNPGLGLGIHANLFHWPILGSDLLTHRWFRLNILVLEKFICWNSNPPPSDGIRRWELWEVIRGHESEVLTSGISALLRKDTRQLAFFLHQMRIQQENGQLQIRKWALAR